MGDLQGGERFSVQRRQFSHFPAVDVVVERPLPVTLIALLQFVKAWFLLMVALVARVVPEALRAVPGLPTILYFAAHGRDTRGPLLPVIGVYVALIGCGLWRLWGWARRSLIFSSVLMVGLWAFRFMNDWNMGQVTFRTSAEGQTVYILVFVDVLIVAYLAFYDGVPQAFEKVKL